MKTERDLRTPVARQTATPRSCLRIFLVDDHAVVRQGLKTLVNAQPDMESIGEVGNGKDLWQRLSDLPPSGLPHVVVMDVSMPGVNGAEATARLKADWPSVKVLAFSMHEDKSYLRTMLEFGASGYVLKRSAAAELIRAIRAVAAGETYLDPALSAAVVETFVHNRPAGTGELGVAEPLLSDREAQVLRLIAQGHANKEIAVRLGLSVKTVETYKARSMEKLDLDGRADIVRYALRQGWLNDL
jgi:Response regulator containing a CheY-like receiver domain and an HTH DNA-binding domain